MVIKDLEVILASLENQEKKVSDVWKNMKRNYEHTR